MNKFISYCKNIFIVLFFVSFCSLSTVASDQNATKILIKSARDCMNIFQFEKAVQLLTEAIRINPDHWEANHMLGRALLRLSRDAEAEKFFAKAVEIDPRNTESKKALGAVYINMAKNAQASNKKTEMTNFIHKACRAYPESPNMWLNLIEIWRDNGEFDKIMSESDLILNSNRTALRRGDDKTLQAVFVIIAKAFFYKNDLPSAEAFVGYASSIRQTNEELYDLRRDIAKLAEKEAAELLREARKLIEVNNYQLAIEKMEKASKLSSGNKAAEELLKKTQNELSIRKIVNDSDKFMAKEDYEAAYAILAETSVLFPEEERITSRLKTVEKIVHKQNAALAKASAREMEERRKRIELEKRVEFMIAEAEKYIESSNFLDAIRCYEDALKLMPDNQAFINATNSLKRRYAQQQTRIKNLNKDMAELKDYHKNQNYQKAYEKGLEMLTLYEEETTEISAILSPAALKLNLYDTAYEIASNLEFQEKHQDLYNYILGDVAYMQKDRNKALAHFKKVSTNSSFAREIRSKKFWIYLYKFQLGLYIAILGLYFPISKKIKNLIKSANQNALNFRVETIRTTGNYLNNIDFLEERYLKQDTKDIKQTAITYAEALLRAERFQEAYDITSNILKKDGRNTHAKRITAESALKLEMTNPNAIDLIQSLYNLDETRKDVVSYLARFYQRTLADHKLAEEYLLKHLAFNPQQNDILEYLANMYVRKYACNQQSEKILLKAINVFPDKVEYYQSLYRCYTTTQNTSEAENILASFKNRFPDKELDTLSAKQQAGSYYIDYDKIGADTDTGYQSTEDPQPAFDTSSQELETDNRIPNSDPKQICPNCNKPNSIKDYYCAFCGKPLSI